MALTQIMTTSFKIALLDGEMDFSGDTSQTFKIALYSSSATLGATTTAYSTTNEITGTGYTAAGKTLTIATNPTSSGTTAYLDFSDVTWTVSTFTARGALIYKSGGTSPSIAVIDFGADQTTIAQSFVIVFPTANSLEAVIRVA